MKKMDFLLYSLMFLPLLYISAASQPTSSQKSILSSPATEKITTSTVRREGDPGATVTSTTPRVSTTGSTTVISSTSSTASPVYQTTGLTGILMSIHSTTSTSQRSTRSPGSQPDEAITSTPQQPSSSSSPQLSRATTQALSPEENAMDSLLSSSPSPTTQPGSSLTMVAFGVMTFILILIIIMVILVATVNMKGQCNNNEGKDKKSWESVIESNVTTSGEKESITLVSMRTINTETDTDSPRLSSVHSTILDNDELEVYRD